MHFDLRVLNLVLKDSKDNPTTGNRYREYFYIEFQSVVTKSQKTLDTKKFSSSRNFLLLL